MRHILFIFIGFILTFAIGCNSKQKDSVQQDNITTSTEEMEVFRRQTFEKFINTEDSIIDKGESDYLIILDIVGKEKVSDEGWYRKNVAHIDSISRYCIKLSNNGNEGELLKILATELGNFKSHPNANTYLCFDLNLIMTSLYFAQADKYPDYLQKCIDLWESNRVQINAVQSGWQQTHPLYLDVLKILSRLYEKTNNTQKVAEMQALINEVTATSD